MKKAVRDTSIAAYHNLILPSIGKRQQAVYDVIQQFPDLSDKEIAIQLGWEINRVTGRRNELEKKGMIFSPLTKLDFISGTHVKAWRIVNLSEVVQQPILIF